MAEDSKTIVGASTLEIASLDDIDEARGGVTVATGLWILQEATQRDKARSQVLWMVDRARRAAGNGCVDDARWWRDRAACALWNMN
jgi:hypothetical protein